MNRWDIYALRDRSGLTRQEFYLEHFRNAGQAANRLEVEGKQQTVE